MTMLIGDFPCVRSPPARDPHDCVAGGADQASDRCLCHFAATDRWSVICLLLPVLVYGGSAVLTNLNLDCVISFRSTRLFSLALESDWIGC